MTINDPNDDPLYKPGGDKFRAQFERQIEVVDAKTVNKFHTKSDKDSSHNAQHHTLGVKHNQASPGNHDHDGVNSLRILAGVTITGAKGGNAALASVIAALVGLGATDSTTA